MASVPIFVDSASPTGDTLFARCTYFCVDAAAAQTDWLGELLRDHVPFLMFGASCVITSPLNGERFTDADLLEELFTLIEVSEGTIIEVNDILVPRALLPAEATARGSVLRADGNFFRRAYAFRTGQMPREEYIASAARADTPLRFSPDETDALRIWEVNVLNEARTYYTLNRDRALPWLGQDEDPGGKGDSRRPPPDLPPSSDLGKLPFIPFTPARRPSWQNQGLNT